MRQAEAELSAKQREIKVWFALVYFGGVVLGYVVMVRKGGKENLTVQAEAELSAKQREIKVYFALVCFVGVGWGGS